MATRVNEKKEKLGTCEHKAPQTTEWMFLKAHEIGFTEIEIDQLKLIYDRTEQSFLKGMK